MTVLPEPLRTRVDAGCHHLHVRDLAPLGVGPHDIRRWRRAGFVEPVGNGGYLIVTASDESHPVAQQREHLRRRVLAVLDTVPAAHACGLSAAIVHRLPTLALPIAVEVASMPPLRTTRVGVTARRAWGGAPVVIGGAWVQPVAECVIDIAGRHGGESGLVTANAALHAGLDPLALDDALGRYGQRIGVTAARRVLQLADGRIESPGESRLQWHCHAAGLVLEPQVVIHDADGSVLARPDFRVEGTNVLLEFDGLLKYDDPSVLAAEKLRHLRLERLGYRIVRVTWRDLAYPDRVVAMIRRAITTPAPRV